MTLEDEKDKDKVAADEDIEKESDDDEDDTSAGSEGGSSEEGDVDEEEDVDDDQSDSSDVDEEERVDDAQDSSESDTDDSVWSEFDGGTEETQEAFEAIALQEFNEGLQCVVKNKLIKAKRIFKDLLQNPIVLNQHKNSDSFEAEDDRLSKMARVFVGIHKNLAVLENDKATDHYVEILSVAPNNPSIWKELAKCMVNEGNLDFAKFALERAPGENVLEMQLAVLFLSKQYHACLEIIKEAVESGTSNGLMLFMKERIRMINEHYRETCDTFFGENRRYDKLPEFDHDSICEYAARIEAAEERHRNFCQGVIDKEDYKVIEVDIEPEYSLEHVLTIFCDLFDRIESYSSPALQTINFRKWGERAVHVATSDVMEDMLNILDVMENVLNTVDSPSFSLMERTERPESMRSVYVRRSVRKIEAMLSYDDSEDESLSNSLSKQLGFKCLKAVTLRTNKSNTRTPSPTVFSDPINEGEFLDSIRSQLIDGSFSICEIIECVLLELSKFSPMKGSVPVNLRLPVTQLYRRLNSVRSNMEGNKWIKLHLLMFELDEPRGEDYCIRQHLKSGWTCLINAFRFAWKYIRTITDEKVMLNYLFEVKSKMADDLVIRTAKGTFGLVEVCAKLDSIQKADRIKSIEELRAANLHEQVNSIISNDIDFNNIENAEVEEMITYWYEALINLGKYEDASIVLTRFLHFLSFDSVILTKSHIRTLGEWVDKLKLDCVAKDISDTLAFYFCQLLTDKNTDWNLWRCLHIVVKQSEGSLNCEYIRELGKSDSDSLMPSKALDVLAKAHEVLGAAKKCAYDEGDFLKYYMMELHDVIVNDDVLDIILQKDMNWLWLNVSEEIAQCLQCAFGRYCKKRKPLNDHETKENIKLDKTYSEIAINLAMPNPMPMFDDKERLGHDVIELLQVKFAPFIAVSEQRKDVVTEFKKWLKSSRKSDVIEDERLSWPKETEENELQSLIWYVLALHHYRQNNHTETILFSTLYLTNSTVTYDTDNIVSAWAMFAHSHVCDLFQLDNDTILYEMEWLTMPYRIAINVDPILPVIHFQHANCLYQVATRLERFLDALPIDDFRRKRFQAIEDLRLESRSHFESALALSKPADNNLIEEFHWLCYFFLAKLHAKEEDYDVIKVADYLFEAACSCQLGDYYYYPLKVNVKKQQNVEPIELHYQIHSVAFKYINRYADPPLETLISLLAYLRSFQRHKVVRSYHSLFTCHPELDQMGIELCLDVCKSQKSPEDDIDLLMDDLITRAEIINEIWDLCYVGFEIVCERFPHPKAHYRLAQMELSRNNIQKCYHHLIRGIFRRKKREDLYFEQVVLITSSDIDRSGSYVFHFERWLRLTISVCTKLNDLSNLLNILIGIVNEVGSEEEDRILAVKYRPLFSYCLKAINSIISKELILPNRSDILRLWNMLEKHKAKSMSLINFVQKVIKELVEKHYGPLTLIINDPSLNLDQKRRTYKKRKNTEENHSMPAKQPLLTFNEASKQLSLTPSSSNENAEKSNPVQLSSVQDPFLLVQLAMQAAFQR